MFALRKHATVTDATLTHISVYPVKGLDAVDLDRVGITPGGGLADDRVYGMYDDEGHINGRRTAAIHAIEASFDRDAGTVDLSAPGRPARTFDVEDDRAALESWLGEHLDLDVTLRGGGGGGHSDRAIFGDGSGTGPTIVSEATLREIASWYDGIEPAEMRRRLRPNLVVEGVEAFWEERLLDSFERAVYAEEPDDDTGEFPRVRIGDAVLEGVEPIPRCAVPTHDPDTGEAYDGFRETFIEQRGETMPPWSGEETIAGNLYTATVGMRIPEAERDAELAVGDSVELLDGA